MGLLQTGIIGESEVYRDDNLGENQINADIFAQYFNIFSVILDTIFSLVYSASYCKRQVVFI